MNWCENLLSTKPQRVPESAEEARELKRRFTATKRRLERTAGLAGMEDASGFEPLRSSRFGEAQEGGLLSQDRFDAVRCRASAIAAPPKASGGARQATAGGAGEGLPFDG